MTRLVPSLIIVILTSAQACTDEGPDGEGTRGAANTTECRDDGACDDNPISTSEGDTGSSGDTEELLSEMPPNEDLPPEGPHHQAGNWPQGCVDHDGDLVPVCDQPVDFPTDCDDNDPITFPGGSEFCDNIDNDCDGLVDEYIGNCETAEIPAAPPADDGSNSLPSVPDPHPVPPSSDWPRGCVDHDGDLVPVCDQPVDFPTDCDDNDPITFPGGSEFCDNIDNDCDGLVDEYIGNCETAEIPAPPP